MHTKFKMTANFVVEEDDVDRKKAKNKKSIFIILFVTLLIVLFAFGLNEKDIFDFIRLIIEVLLSR